MSLARFSPKRHEYQPHRESMSHRETEKANFSVSFHLVCSLFICLCSVYIRRQHHWAECKEDTRRVREWREEMFSFYYFPVIAFSLTLWQWNFRFVLHPILDFHFNPAQNKKKFFVSLLWENNVQKATQLRECEKMFTDIIIIAILSLIHSLTFLDCLW